MPSAFICRGGPIAAPSAVAGDLAADRRGCALKAAGDRAHRLSRRRSRARSPRARRPEAPAGRAGAQAARRRRARAGCCGSSRALDRAPGQCRLTDSPAFQRSHNSRRSAAVYTRRARATPTPSTGSSGPKCCADGLNSPFPALPLRRLDPSPGGRHRSHAVPARRVGFARRQRIQSRPPTEASLPSETQAIAPRRYEATRALEREHSRGASCNGA